MAVSSTSQHPVLPFGMQTRLFFLPGRLATAFAACKGEPTTDELTKTFQQNDLAGQLHTMLAGF